MMAAKTVAARSALKMSTVLVSVGCSTQSLEPVRLTCAATKST